MLFSEKGYYSEHTQGYVIYHQACTEISISSYCGYKTAVGVLHLILNVFWKSTSLWGRVCADAVTGVNAM